jgi:hypothetical protein
MSRRLSQRRQVDRAVRDQLIDEAFARYLDWLTECEAVDAAYWMWLSTAPSDAALPFAAYRAALDREELAASFYGSAINRIERLFGAEERSAGAPPAGASRSVSHPAAR